MVRTVKKPEERRDDILQAGCQLFLTKGYENTTMSDVMKRLNIAKGTIYHYFSSKEDLLGAVIEYFADQQILSQRKILEETSGNGLERLQQFVIRSSQQDDHDELLDHLHKPANAGMHIRILARIISVQAPLYAELIQQGCEEGIFTTENPLECAEFMLAGVQFLTDAGIAPWSEEELQRRVTALPHLLESLLQAPAGSFNFLADMLGDHRQHGASG